MVVDSSSLIAGRCIVARAVVSPFEVASLVGCCTFERRESSETHFASIPRARRHPKKVKRGRKPCQRSPTTCVDVVDGGGSSPSVISSSVRRTPLDSGTTPGGAYWTRVKKAWLVCKFFGCTFDGRDEAAIRGMVQEMKEWWPP